MLLGDSEGLGTTVPMFVFPELTCAVPKPEGVDGGELKVGVADTPVDTLPDVEVELSMTVVKDPEICGMEL